MVKAFKLQLILPVLIFLIEQNPMVKHRLEPITSQPPQPHHHHHPGREPQKMFSLNDHDALNFKAIDTLQSFKSNTLKRKPLFRETDTRFLNDLRKMIKLRNNKYLAIIKNQKANLTVKQYDELDYRARIHGKANTINENSKLDFDSINKIDRCHCGCKKGKGKLISLFTDEQKLKSLGPGVLLQFLFNKASALMLFLVVLIYTIFSMLTNLIGSEAKVNPQCMLEYYCRFKQAISDQNKPMNFNFHLAQSWLGLAFCLTWIVATKVLKYFGHERNRIIDQKLRSASDYAIKVQNLPRGKYEETQVINHIQEVWKRKVKKQKEKKEQQANPNATTTNFNVIPNNDPNNQVSMQIPSKQSIPNILQESDRSKYNLRIKSIQIIYNMEFSRKMSEEIFKIAQELNLYLISEDGGDSNRNLVFSYEDYLKTKEKLKDTYELFKDLRKRFLNDAEFRKKLSTTCALIQFQSQKTRKMVLQYFGAQKVGLGRQLLLRIKSCFSSTDHSVFFKGRMLKIERAPQPSDILWTNCQQDESLYRKLGIFMVSLLIMIISFAIIFGLEMSKIYIKNNPDLIKVQIVITVINYATTFALQITNAVLWQIMSWLLQREYNHTKTQKIISLMNRVLILSSINVIILPILSNYVTFVVYGNNLMYGNEGLSGLAFDYHISSIIATLKKLFSISAIIRTILIGVRCMRHKLIWYLCKDPDHIDFRKGDPQVNKFYEGDEFDIAENYIFITTSILHAAFFCKLQPIILFIIGVNICVFLFVNRVKILRLCKIPDMTDYLLFQTAVWMLGLVPVYYGVGWIALSYLQNKQDPLYPFSAQGCIASIICIAIGIFGLANPGGVLNNLLLYLIKKCECIDLDDIMGEYEGENVQGHSDEEEGEQDSSVGQFTGMGATKDGFSTGMGLGITGGTSPKKNLNSRIESYYVNSNSLSLLGFEKVLKGQDHKVAFRQLRTFCERFFPKNRVNQHMTVHKFAEIVIKGNLKEQHEDLEDQSISKTDRQDN